MPDKTHAAALIRPSADFLQVQAYVRRNCAQPPIIDDRRMRPAKLRRQPQQPLAPDWLCRFLAEFSRPAFPAAWRLFSGDRLRE